MKTLAPVAVTLAVAGFLLFVSDDGKLTGLATVTDGDTIQISGQRIRLHGIDAPEIAQECIRAGRVYPCGREAADALKRVIGGQSVACKKVESDRHGRIVATCRRQDGTDIGANLVSQGWALAYRRYSLVYVELEDAAKASGFGLWAGTFTAPWDWRLTR